MTPATLQPGRTYPLTRYRLELVRERPWQVGCVSSTDQPMPCASAQGAVQILQALGVDREPAETLGVLYVDQRNRLIGFSLLYRGTINGAACEPRGIFQGALLANAAGIILFHNHPSGDPSPSAEDLCFTRSVAEIGELLRIRLIDHVVIGEGGKFASMKERGW